MVLPHLPLEIQILIVESADEVSDYATLSLVCKAWRNAAEKVVRKLYCEPFVPDKAWLEKSTRAEPWPYIVLDTAAPEFLIHFAIHEFPGYLRGNIFPTGWPFCFYAAQKKYMDPKDDPRVLAYMSKIRNCLNDPVIVSKKHFQGGWQLNYNVKFQIMRYVPHAGGNVSTKPSMLCMKRGTVELGETPKVKEVLGWLFALQYDTVLGHPTSPTDECVVYTVGDPWGAITSPEGNKSTTMLINIQMPKK
ncbi:hypothetical protein H072_5788 [Dactylellina haptotyla CBS 200.50]|uniref:F-box domain-containing protein n=1 Tax=Dactylellina haptotyla (strain CBS 200.50) TaxID=1284197 RepID=S8AGX7_DACHA|nr:hypothetical protein H072_5788 [Dactylellina haptotyla CBS 200.50]